MFSFLERRSSCYTVFRYKSLLTRCDLTGMILSQLQSLLFGCLCNGMVVEFVLAAQLRLFGGVNQVPHQLVKLELLALKRTPVQCPGLYSVVHLARSTT